MTITEHVLLKTETFPEVLIQTGTRNPADHGLRLILPASFEIPDGSLLLGQASDKQPVLLNLYDPRPGPLLVTGDGGCGKTRFLQSLARMSDLQDPGDITFGVVTPFPEEWTLLEAQPNCLGIWPAYHPSAARFLSSLVGWSEWLPKTRQVVLLLYDGLDLVLEGGFKSLADLRALVKNGPRKQVWPVISSNAGRLSHMRYWMKYFHMTVLGQVRNRRSAPLLVDKNGIHQAGLLETGQYLVSDDLVCKKFTLPPQENGDLV